MIRLLLLLAVGCAAPVFAQRLAPTVGLAGGYDLAGRAPTGTVKAAFWRGAPDLRYGLELDIAASQYGRRPPCADVQDDDCPAAPLDGYDRRFGRVLLVTVGPVVSTMIVERLHAEGAFRLGVGHLAAFDDDLASDELGATAATAGLAVAWGGGLAFDVTPRLAATLRYDDTALVVGTLDFADAGGAATAQDPGTVRAQRLLLGLRLSL